MTRRIFLYVLCVFFGAYLLFPVIAGIFALGERCGPVVYFRQHHEMLYSLGYNFTHEDTCRCDCVFFHRPPLYGHLRKKKTVTELSPYIQKKLKNSPESLEIFNAKPEYAP